MDPKVLNMAQIMGQPKLSLIYVIEDDKDVHPLLEQALGQYYKVKIFESPIEALLAAERERPSSILLDVHMPNIDGIEVLKQFREQPFTSDVPIICTSASYSAELREELQENGADGMITKPYDIKTLGKVFSGLLEGINKKVVSQNGRHTCSIAFNEREKRKLIRGHLLKNLEAKKDVVFLSWTQGQDLLTEQELPYLKSNQLIFLEFNPTIIIKFPYLHNLSPVFADIFEFLPKMPNEYHLIFDNPRHLYDIHRKENALAKTLSLAQMIHTSFASSDIFMIKSHDHKSNLFTMNLAKIFVGEGRS